MARQFFTIGVALLACCLVLAAASMFNPGTAQQPPALALMQPNWRYQIHSWGSTGYLVLLDTQTGRCWMKSLASDWVDMKSPAVER
jgi:hypothetical protein